MMKPRSNRVVAEQAPASSRQKAETATNGQASARAQAQLNNQPTSAQNIRKRRSSINVYDQPSSLNSRLRQLETDMLRLDEDRTKLFDDTHSALAQYELKLGEIHAILKSRQDNVEKYVEDMKMLLQAKEEFERQTKLLNEKHERIHEKFMHRETTISREIKLLKNKFDLLEKNRQFRSILQKSSNASTGTAGTAAGLSINDDLASGLDSNEFHKTRSETGSELDSLSTDPRRASSSAPNANKQGSRTSKNVRIKLSKFDWFIRPFTSLIGRSSKARRRHNRVSSLANSRPVLDQRQQQQQLAAADDQRMTYELNGNETGDKELQVAQDVGALGAAEVAPSVATKSTKATPKSKRQTLLGRLISNAR